MKKLCFILGILSFLGTQLCAQSVGVVLSGGGSTGTAHIGVLKALEENNIPIDYIAGTSMGALIGGLYAMGYSPDEILASLSSPDFQKMVSGKLDNKYISFYRQPPADAGWIGIEFRIDSTFRPTIPVNLVSTTAMDFTLMEATAAINKTIKGNFDSLFIPFRCVAADIYNKREVILRSGDLGKSLRATATYPFYFKPISIDGVLLYDGGLYNNFPANVIYNDFLPDIIIGSTVAREQTPPGEDDIYSQIKNMLMNRQNYGEVCETDHMIIIKPDVDRRTILDFKNIVEMVNDGYHSTQERIDDIKKMVSRRVTNDEIKAKRITFKNSLKIPSKTIIKINGLNKSQTQFTKSIFKKDIMGSDWKDFRTNYYRFSQDEAVQSIYPSFKPSNGSVDTIELQVKLKNKFEANFGGLISSNPINTGFVSLNYRYTGRIASKFDVNSYFGKFYSSLQLRSNFYFPWRLPISLELSGIYNSYNFFRSQTSFFEVVKPSYLIQYERIFNTALVFPTGVKGKLSVGLSLVNMFDEYYQTTNFGPGDTTDVTTFNHNSWYVQYDYNTMNRKFYPSRGQRIYLTARLIDGVEKHEPGSTTIIKDIYRKEHSFFRARLRYENYVEVSKYFSFGFLGEAMFTNQPFFNNYTSSILQSPSFLPIPEMQTVFLNQYRTHNYAALGFRTIFTLAKNLDLRGEAYAFQPYKLIDNVNGIANYSGLIENQFFAFSSVLVYHTPIAPIAVSVNYFDRNTDPWSVMFTMGFLIFNKRAFD